MVDGTREGSEAFPAAAEAALLKGGKIEAIKIVRESRNVDLKDAKEIVERHLAARPDIEQQLAAAGAEARKGILPWLIVVIAAAVLAYYYLASK